mmetsp:Transcript_73438/g.175008  ORF Transcript_73438/g.175008 Transcript_73438/m.175008 type:complete len:484 (+) Transcript_73438:202-1653(+)
MVAPGEAGSQPPGGSRMLRIEHKGQAYDWFNLDELSDVVRMNDFANTLRENVAHYFGVPTEWQAIYDEEGLLITGVDFARALQSVRPWLRVYDIREMMPDFREQTALKLTTISNEVTRMQRNLRLQSSTAPASAGVGAAPSVEYSTHAASALNGTTVTAVKPPPASPLLAGRPAWTPMGGPLPAQPNVVATTVMQPLSPRPGVPSLLPPAPPGAALSPQPSLLQPGLPFSGRPISPARCGTPPRCGSAPPPMSEPQVLTMPQLTPPAAIPPPVLPTMRPPTLRPPMPMPVAGAPKVLPPPCGGSTLLPPGGALQSPCAGPATPPPPMGPWSGMPCGPCACPVGPSPSYAPQVVREPVVAGAQRPMNGYMRPPMGVPMQDRSGVVEVLLTKDSGGRDGGQRFGFANILTQDGKGLVISWIDENGLTARWNHQHPDKAVMEGDRILAVNSASDDIEAMRAQLQLDSIRMLVQRYARSGLPPPAAC